MITGPLAFRSNEWRRHNGKFVLTSPTRSEFEWTEPIAWAKCDTCPTDKEGHVIIQQRCSCGIYATLTKSTLNDYIYSQNSVVTLVEALDSNLDGSNPHYSAGSHIWLHYDWQGREWCAGFTAPGAQIVYIVDTHKRQKSVYRKMTNKHDMTPLAIAVTALSQQFHVDIISYEDAIAIAKIQWHKFGAIWHGE